MITNNRIKLKLDGEKIDETKDDIDIIRLYPQLKLIKSYDKYCDKYPNGYIFCYNYALNDYHIEEIDEAYIRLWKNYKIITKNEAKKGDIISIHKIDYRQKDHYERQPSSYNCRHYAIIHKIVNGEIIIRSKWGICGVFEGTLEDLPKDYGNVYQIWRRQ